MNRLKRMLSKWSKESYGDIFQKVSTLEDVIKVKEVQLEVHCSDENMRDLNKAEEELQKFYQLEEDFWKQKSGMKWFNDGDRNTKFFHSYVKGRRRRLLINEIEDENRAILREDKSIGEEAVKVFEDQFAAGAVSDDQAMLNCIPHIITEEQKEKMDRTPEEEEVRDAIFSLNSESASGLDGFSGKFFQACWEIIKEDIVKLVIALFCGWELPRYVIIQIWFSFQRRKKSLVLRT
ncbi:hypothetical protein KY290_013973 [Solanum tuberosum]|uniref:RNA-directed DNA polymerase (Reverse transcriptase) n=1 Tax=Solanum tuberosum TaxID=4113 RepID=A0ABQ7VNA9_SOLTU|nr:hypothetical protein KY290_013973 [Solanum tuberosum]